MKVSLRDEKAVLELIDLCASLEDKALSIYEGLLARETNPRRRDLWASMVADEKEHRHFWARLKEACAAGGVPEVFDEPRRYADEVRTLATRLDHVEAKLKEDSSAPGVFVEALRLEFLLLHPSFVILFHCLPDDADNVSPSCTYEQHLGRLLSALMDYRELSPELELLGEAIGQVWKKSEEGVTRTVTDPLTGALNRRGLSIAMKPLAFLARRDMETAGVLIMEIANLKEINGRFGRRVGDSVLAATAEAIASRLRASDVFGRLGGDDFLVLLTRFDPSHFERVGGEFLGRAEKTVIDGARPVLRMGGARSVIGAEAEKWLEALIGEADSALEEARASSSRSVYRVL